MSTLAEDLLENFPETDGAYTVTLSGELGAGKTALTQMFARKLGVTDHVTSPTFGIMRSYETADEKFKTLVHIDAYRIEDEKEVEVLHIPELFEQPHTLVCIEWPEHVKGVVPSDALNINIVANESGERSVTVS